MSYEPRVIHLSVKKGGKLRKYRHVHRGGNIFKKFYRSVIKPAYKKVVKPALDVVKDVGQVATPFLKEIPVVGQAIEMGEKLGFNPFDYEGNIKMGFNALKHPGKTLKKGLDLASSGALDSLMGDELAAKFHSAKEHAQDFYKEGKDLAEHYGIDPKTLAEYYKGYKGVMDEAAERLQQQGVQATAEDVHRNVPAIAAEYAERNNLSEEEKRMLMLRSQGFSTKEAMAMSYGFDPNGPYNKQIVQGCYNANDMTKQCLAPAFNRAILPGVPAPV